MWRGNTHVGMGMLSSSSSTVQTKRPLKHACLFLSFFFWLCVHGRLQNLIFTTSRDQSRLTNNKRSELNANLSCWIHEEFRACSFSTFGENEWLQLLFPVTKPREDCKFRDNLRSHLSHANFHSLNLIYYYLLFINAILCLKTFAHI